jgi:hypothetical protein
VEILAGWNHNGYHSKFKGAPDIGAPCFIAQSNYCLS